MLHSHFRFIGHRYGFLEAAAQRLWKNFLSQNSLKNQSGNLVAIPFVEAHAFVGTSSSVRRQRLAYCLVDISAKRDTDNNFESPIPSGNTIINVNIKYLVERGSQGLRRRIPVFPLKIS